MKNFHHWFLTGVLVLIFAAVPSAYAQSECVLAPEGLVAWWPADSSAEDIVAANHGTLHGVGFGSGIVADAFSFDGAATARVEIPDSGSLRFAGSFTIDAWVKTTSGGTDHTPPVGVFVADIVRKRHRDNGGKLDIVLGMINNTNGACCGDPTPGPVARFVIVDDHSNFTFVNGTTIINDGAWHLIAGVRDTTTGVVQLFVDGQLDGSAPDSTTTFFEANAVPWFIGNTSGLGPFGIFPWDGLIDEVEIFNRAVSLSDIQAIYGVGMAGKCKDEDGDGFRPPDDCDETDASINPDGLELPGNFVDENCDGDLGDCSPCNEWRNHGEYIRCTSQAVSLLVSGGALTEEEGDALVTSAARSDVGKKSFVPPAECTP